MLDFENDDDDNVTTISANAKHPGMFLTTPLSKSSNCSLNFDVLMVSDNANITMVVFKMNNYTVQAFHFTDNTTFDGK